MDQQLHALRFPGESDEYRHARNELLGAEMELRRQIEAVATQRRSLPRGGELPTDYVFDESSGQGDGTHTVRLSELFEDGKDTLFLYSFMFNPDDSGQPLTTACPSCTSIIDALDGEARHIAQHINLAVSTKAPIQRFRDHARARGWRNIRLLSSANTTYNHDYHAEVSDENQTPVATVFVRRDGAVHHFWSSELCFAPTDAGLDPRHVNFMWPLWTVLDRTPDGRGHWRPELPYA
jgi:predicted dithiol-disulfide oxidoreductase (DUF899 family)